MTTPTKHINQLVRNVEAIEGKPFSKTEIDAKNLPTLDRLLDKEDVVIIPFITDTHSASNSLDTKNSDDGVPANVDSLDAMTHLDDVLSFATKFKVDAIVHGGDIIDGKSSRSDSAKDLRTLVAKAQTAKFTNAAAKNGTSTTAYNTPIPVLFAKGNHDDNVLTDTTNRASVALKAQVLDPILRNTTKDTRVIFPAKEIAKKEFNSSYAPYMGEKEYYTVNKFVKNPSDILSRENGSLIKSIISSATTTSTSAPEHAGYQVTLTSAEKTALNNLVTAAEAGKKPVFSNYDTTGNLLKALKAGARCRLRGAYGHLDVKGVRIIILDAYDIPYEDDATIIGDGILKYPIRDFGGFSATQVQWFADTLFEAKQKSLPVVIFGHHALTGAGFTRDGGPRIRNGATSGDEYWIGNIELMKAIIDDYINGKSNTISTLDAIKIYSGLSSNSLAARATVYLNESSDNSLYGLTPYSFYNNVTVTTNVKKDGKVVQLTHSLPFAYDKSISKKKAISTHSSIQTVVQTKFSQTTGTSTLIGVVTGHSHVARTAIDEVTGKYVNFMSNCSFRAGKAVKGLTRTRGKYTQNSWEVIVIDKTNGNVLIYPMGAMMINQDVAKSKGFTSTTIETEPVNLTGDGIFPVRSYIYKNKAPQILEYAILQGDKA